MVATVIDHYQTFVLEVNLPFVYITDKKAKGKNPKPGKNKGKSGKQSALTSPDEDTDRRHNLKGSKQCLS